jgi:hypothetical protein
MPVFQGNALDALREWLTRGDTVSPASVGPIISVTSDTEFPAAAALADSSANPTTTGVGAYLMGWSGSTWSRTGRSIATSTDGMATTASNIAFQMVALGGAFNGTTFDRTRTGSAANLSAVTQIPLLTTPAGEWAVDSAPAAGTVASASKTAGAAGVRHVCRSINFGINTAAIPPVATTLTVVLRDGATGAGTVLRTWSIRVPASADVNVFTKEISGLNIVGTAATAMTVEFSGGLANTTQYAGISGFSVI